MTVSPAAENYLYNVMGPYYASLALGRSEHVPSPFEDVERGYFLYPGSGRSSAPQAEVPADYTLDESSDREPNQPTTTGTQSKLSGTMGKMQTAIDDYITDRVEAYMGFPEAVNPLTGTVRATGLSPMMKGMMPNFFGPLMDAGYKANMANLSMLANASQTSDRFSTGLMGNQLVGVQPTETTLGGAILEGLGFDVEGYTLSGNVGGFTNVDQAAYEDALVTSLLYNQPTAYGPARAVAMGLDPQVTYSQTENKYNVATLLGIDPFGPNPGLAVDSAFQGFQVNGEGRPDPTRPGSIVGSYDPSGNWQPVTNPYSGYAFSNMPGGTTVSKLTDAGFSFFERPGGQFEVYSPDTGWGPGGGIGSPHDNTATSQSNQSGGGNNTTSSGTYGSYSDLSGSPHEPDGGGGGGSSSGPGNAGSGSSCFAAGTKFFMEDGSLKNIEDIKIGDVLQKGGKVRTVIVGDGLYETWFLYGSTKVTGTHTVFENNTWKRIQNSDNATPTDKDEFVYTLINENHRLVAEDGVMFGDYDEVDNLDIEDDLLAMMNEMHNA